MRERETCRVAEPARRPVNDLRDHRQRAHRPCADAGHEQQLFEIRRSPLRSRRQGPMKTALDDVSRPNVMMIGHDEVREEALRGLRLGFNPSQLANDAVRSRVREQIKLQLPRSGCAVVGQVDDLALVASVLRLVGDRFVSPGISLKPSGLRPSNATASFRTEFGRGPIICN